MRITVNIGIILKKKMMNKYLAGILLMVVAAAMTWTTLWLDHRVSVLEEQNTQLQSQFQEFIDLRQDSVQVQIFTSDSVTVNISRI